MNFYILETNTQVSMINMKKHELIVIPCILKSDSSNSQTKGEAFNGSRAIDKVISYINKSIHYVDAQGNEFTLNFSNNKFEKRNRIGIQPQFDQRCYYCIKCKDEIHYDRTELINHVFKDLNFPMAIYNQVLKDLEK